MRKRKVGRKLSLKRDQRKALLKSLATALFEKEKIKTTEAKAKEASRFSEKCISRAKKGDLASRRYLMGLFSPRIAGKLMDEIANRYGKRRGGYTRVIKLGRRPSDSAAMAVLELVEGQEAKASKIKTKTETKKQDGKTNS